MPPSVCSSRCMSTQQNKSHPQPPLWTEKINSQPIRCLELSASTNQRQWKILTLESSGQRRVQHYGLWRAASTCGASLAPNVTILGPAASQSSDGKSLTNEEKCLVYLATVLFWYFMICSQCLECQEWDPEAVRGLQVFSHSSSEL